MKKILIIDDDKEIREILEEFFRKEFSSRSITFAKDGLEGFAESYLQKFDLICTDHEMPFLKGGDLLTAIRTKPGLNQHTPVIIVTALMSELPETLKNLEKTYFIDKPFEFKRLTRYVKMALLQDKKEKDIIMI